MLHYLAEYWLRLVAGGPLEEAFSPLRLFNYITFRSGGALLTAWILCMGAGRSTIYKLKSLKFSQNYTDVAGSTHAESNGRDGKKGTPTMGGALILVAVVLSTLLWTKWTWLVLWSLIPFVTLGMVGVLDDWTKLKQKKGIGISGKIKVAAQTLMALGLTLFLYSNEVTRSLVVDVVVPFRHEPIISGSLAIGVILVWFTITGSSNAVNITDGLDGLAVGCVVITAFCLLILTYAAGNIVWADYLLIRYVAGAGELSIICAAVIGAGLGFLWFNAYPAKVFMGDTGSLALGGILGSIAIMVHQPFVLLIAGGVFVIEALSVVIQRGYFKYTRRRYGEGRRVFRMAPIHHHFEKLGWSEPTIVMRFYIVSIIFAILALGTLKIR